MKGVILAGGTGSRLSPLTKITNKHLLPIYDRPMIYFPLATLKQMGITEVMIVSGRGHAGHFLELLGGGSNFGMQLSYEVQQEAGGIAQALKLTQQFVGDDSVCVILGDNVFEDDLSAAKNEFLNSSKQAHIFLKKVDEPEHYGVPRFEGDRIVEIIEKPKEFISPHAVTGAYLYRSDVFKVISECKPSARGELEISTVNDHYVQKGQLSHSTLEGFWGDCGESIDGMHKVASFIQRENARFKNF